MSHACHRFRKCYKNLTFSSLLTRCIIPEACQKCSESVSFLHFLPSKYASCHNSMHFFDISTSKLAPTLRCFVHFAHFVLSKMISYNMTLETDLLWALRAAIPQGKLERGERERYIHIYTYIYIYIYIYLYFYLFIYLFICK